MIAPTIPTIAIAKIAQSTFWMVSDMPSSASIRLRCLASHDSRSRRMSWLSTYRLSIMVGFPLLKGFFLWGQVLLIRVIRDGPSRMAMKTIASMVAGMVSRSEAAFARACSSVRSATRSARLCSRRVW